MCKSRFGKFKKNAVSKIKDHKSIRVWKYGTNFISMLCKYNAIKYNTLKYNTIKNNALKYNKRQQKNDQEHQNKNIN